MWFFFLMMYVHLFDGARHHLDGNASMALHQKTNRFRLGSAHPNFVKNPPRNRQKNPNRSTRSIFTPPPPHRPNGAPCTQIKISLHGPAVNLLRQRPPPQPPAASPPSICKTRNFKTAPL